MPVGADEIIFHNYALSPFSEKIRKVFAHKNIGYRSVDQPMWMPKPNLTPLTGGFRRIPVLQIGADVYCDTSLMCRKLEELCPEPTLYPRSQAATAETMACWADRMMFFGVCAPLVFGAISELLPPELIEDRKRMRPDLDPAELKKAAPQLGAALRAYLGWLERGLEQTRFVAGDEFSVADAAVYHCLWFVRNDPASAEKIAALPKLSTWIAGLDATGDGNAVETDPADALEVARNSEPAPTTGESVDLAPGTKVGICSDDLTSDVIEGEISSCGEQEVVIVRRDDDLGEVAVHFPRAGYYITPM